MAILYSFIRYFFSAFRYTHFNFERSRNNKKDLMSEKTTKRKAKNSTNPLSEKTSSAKVREALNNPSSSKEKDPGEVPPSTISATEHSLSEPASEETGAAKKKQRRKKSGDNDKGKGDRKSNGKKVFIGGTEDRGPVQRRREDVILEKEGVTRRKITDDEDDLSLLLQKSMLMTSGLRVRIDVQRYVAVKSAPLCKGSKNKKCLFGKGDVVDVLCPDDIGDDGKAMVVVHKAKFNKEYMLQRCLSEYEGNLMAKERIECDFPVIKMGHLKLQSMVECYYLRITDEESLWIDKRLVKELPPGAVPAQVHDVLVPVCNQFADRYPSTYRKRKRHSKPLVSSKSAADGGSEGDVDANDGSDDAGADTASDGGSGAGTTGQKDAGRVDATTVGENGRDGVCSSLPLFHNSAVEFQYGVDDDDDSEIDDIDDDSVSEGVGMSEEAATPIEESIQRLGIIGINDKEGCNDLNKEGDGFLSLPLSTQCREQLQNGDKKKRRKK